MADQLVFNIGADTKDAVNQINTFFNAVDQSALQAKKKLADAFNQKLETEVKVAFKGGKLVAREVFKAKQETQKLAEIQKAVNGELGKTPNKLKKQLAILRQLKGDTQKFKNGTNEVTQEWYALTERIKAAKKQMAKLSDSDTGSGGGGLNGFIKRLTLANIAVRVLEATLRTVIGSIGAFVQSAMRMETLQLQLEAFTGGAKQAAATFKGLADVAANSPFNLEQVASAAKTMMAFGMEADAAVKATEQLAVVSAATGGDVSLLARNMGQIVAQGRAYTRDLTQFAIQGIPIWQQLSYVTGESVSALKDLAREGKIGGAEVSAALDLMTMKGSDFEKIASRMQETFKGRFAKIEASFQELALAAVNTFNKMDAAFGKPIANSMKGFAAALKSIAESFDLIARAAAAAAIAVGTYMAIAAVNKILAVVHALGGIVSIFKMITDAIKGATLWKTILMGLSGPQGWLALTAGLAVGIGAFRALDSKMKESTKEARELQQEVNEVANATGKLSDQEKKVAKQSGYKDRLKSYEDISKLADLKKSQLDRELETLKAMEDGINARYDKEKEKIDEAAEKIENKIQREKDAYDLLKDKVQTRYDTEIEKLNQLLDKTREKNNAEISALQAKTPAEQKLYDLQKKELQAKIQKGGLEEKEKLELQARLERMNAQEKIQRLQVQHKKEEKALAEQIKEKEKERKTVLDEMDKKQEQRIKFLENQLDVQKTKAKENEKARDKELSQLKDIDKAIKGINTDLDTSTRAVAAQVAKVQSLSSEYRNLKTQVDNAATSIRNLNAAKNASGRSSGNGDDPTTSNFTGGPIAAGTTSWVNELGKEAFLSASGRLSMINDKHGKWTAPSDGTIIPAHLTKKLDIPAGGVNLNQGSAAGRAGGGNRISKSALSTANNTITNNVTIQSSNPTQTANNMMVQLQRLRRGRMGR